VVAAGFEKSVVMLDMRKILSSPVTAFQSTFATQQNEISQNFPKLNQGSTNPTMHSMDFQRNLSADLSHGVLGDNGALNRNNMSQNLNNMKQTKDESKI
jgi:hypothetical protein